MRKPDAFVLGRLGVAVDHRPLDFDRAADCIDDARILDQQTVAGGLDDAPMMFADLGVDELATVGPQVLERALFVRSHQSRIARDISGEDRRKTAPFSRGYRLARPFAPVGDAAVTKCARLGHLVSPASLKASVQRLEQHSP
jgi:hypothetical protein